MLNILLYILVILACNLAIFSLLGLFLIIIIPEIRDIIKSKKDNKNDTYDHHINKRFIDRVAFMFTYL